MGDLMEGLPVNWTQTVQPGNNIMIYLAGDDVTLLDEDGVPMAILVSPDRYRRYEK
jgi:hypothetical protein